MAQIYIKKYFWLVQFDVVFHEFNVKADRKELAVKKKVLNKTQIQPTP